MGGGPGAGGVALGSRAWDRSSLGAMAAPALLGFFLLLLELVDGHAQYPARALDPSSAQEGRQRQSRQAQVAEALGAFLGCCGLDEPALHGKQPHRNASGSSRTDGFWTPHRNNLPEKRLS